MDPTRHDSGQLLDSIVEPAPAPPAARPRTPTAAPPEPARPRAPRVGTATLALPGLLLYLVHVFGQRPVFIDDAYIFHRYAANWAAGLGPVYNAGEWVEGYSSLLWTAVLALGARLGLTPERLAPALAVLCGAATILLAARLARAIAPGTLAAPVAVALACALGSGLAYYAAAGMDTAPFAFVLIGAVAATRRALAGGGAGPLMAALAGLVLVRAEGALYALAILAILGVTRLRGRAMLRPGLWGALATVTVAAIALQLGFRRTYYGLWIPATLAAKSYATHLLSQALAGDPSARRPLFVALARGARYALPLAPILALPGLVLAFRAVRRERTDPLVSILAAVIAVGIGVAAWAGGDWMPFQRHLAPLWAPALLLLAWSLHDLLARMRARAPEEPRGEWTPVRLPGAAPWLVAGALLIAGLSGLQAPFTPAAALSARAFREERSVRWMREVGTLLAAYPEPVSVATNVAGKLPYHAGPGVHVRDLLGLTDRHNALRGELWVPTYGRQDPAYAYGPPLDMLVTNTAGDLRALHAEAGPLRPYLVFMREDWLVDRFVLAVRADHPIVPRLEDEYGTAFEPLTEERIAVVRAFEDRATARDRRAAGSVD